jgi:flagellar assembly factor FliW
MAQITTRNFGDVEFESQDIIHVIGGMPGFEGLTRFLLIEGEGFEPLKFLQSLDNPMISFPLVPPKLINSEYRAELNPEQKKQLKLDNLQDGLTYSIVTLTEDPAKATVNLFAPLVINSANMRASQIALLDSGYAVDEPLLRV